MFIPLHDDTPHQVIRFQWVSGAIMLINLAAFLWLRYGPGGGEAAEVAVMQNYGVVPLFITQAQAIPAGLLTIPPPATLLTYSFLHAGWGHLVTNLLFIWVFADNVEDAFGRVSFVLFYLICGLAAGLVHVVMMPGSPDPLVGASGAVAGILGAYLVLYPRARVWVLLFLRLPLRLPAAILVAGWIGLQVLALVVSTDPGVVAWWAHIGGFAAGLVLTLLLKRRLAAPRTP